MNVGDVKATITGDAGPLISELGKAQKALGTFGNEAAKAGSQAEKAGGGFESLGKKLAAAFTAGAILKVMDGALRAQAEQEAAINKLNLALANQGQYTAEASKSLVDYSAAMQDVSTYADEVILGGEAMLASFGLSEEQIRRSTKAALDYAAATGTDVSSAFQTMGKASAGSVAMLQRQGFAFAEGMSNAQKFEAALSQVEQRFGGSAAAATQTYTGALAQLKNAFGDAQEGLGKFLGELTGGDKPFQILIDAAKKLSSFFSGTLIIALSELRAQILEVFAGLAESGAKVYDLLAKTPGFKVAGVQIGASAKDKADATAQAQTLRDSAANARLEAAGLREVGDAAATANGHILTFANANSKATSASAEATKALKKQAEELQKFDDEMVKSAAKHRMALQNEMEKGALAQADRTAALMLSALGPKRDPFKDLGMDDLQKENAKKLSSATVREEIKTANVETVKWQTSLQAVTNSLLLVGNSSSKLAGVAKAFAGITNAIGGAAAGVEMFKAGSKQGGLQGMLGQIGGVASIGASVVGLIGGLFGGGKKRKEEEKKRKDEAEQKGVEQLKALQDRWDSFKEKTLTGGVSGLQSMFAALGDGTGVSAERMQRLGTIGVAVFESLRKSGMSMVDALKAMAPALEAATKAGVALPNTVLGDLTAFQGLVSANEELVSSAEGLGQVMSALQVTGSLTQETFTALSAEAGVSFGSMVEQGFTANQALAVLAPTLYAIQQAAAAGGYAVDAATQSMINEASQAGLLEGLKDPMAELIEIQKLMLEATSALASVFGAQLPASVAAYIDSLHKIPTNVSTTVETNFVSGGGGDVNTGQGGGGDYPGFAGGSGGFMDFGSGTPVVLHGREAVVTEGEFAGFGAMASQIAGLRADIQRQNRIQSVAIRDAVLLSK